MAERVIKVRRKLMEGGFLVGVGSSLIVVAVGGLGYFWLTAKRERRQPGPAGTEKLANPGDPDYDEKLRALWGGPPPKYFPDYWVQWPTQFKLTGKKTALVTGGIGGIGFYVSKLLARMGYELILPTRTGFEEDSAGARDAIQAAVPGAKVTIPSLPLDLDSFESVRAFSAALRQELQCLDLLCLNAGRGGSKGDPREDTKDGIEAIIQVNAVSHFLLTAELLPLLRASGSARVVSQTSMARLCDAPGLPARKVALLNDMNSTTDSGAFNAFHQYQISKAGNVWFTQGLNARLEKAGILNVTAIVSDPGFSSTGVNIQHNLGHSFLPLPEGWLRTKTLHALGQHAADGALPMCLACLDPAAQWNDWYTAEHGTKGRPVRGSASTFPKANIDPWNVAGSDWPKDASEIFWAQAQRWTKADWAGL